jgi:cytochrome b561
MSLDNVLAVAGAAKDHPWVLVTGLAISVVLMGVAATLIANLLNRHRWIAWVGLLVILYVAVDMIWHGTSQVAGEVPGAYAYLLLPLGYLALPNVFPAWMWAAATLAHVALYTLVATLVVGLVRGDREEAAASAERWPASANAGSTSRRSAVEARRRKPAEEGMARAALARGSRQGNTRSHGPRRPWGPAGAGLPRPMTPGVSLVLLGAAGARPAPGTTVPGGMGIG